MFRVNGTPHDLDVMTVLALLQRLGVQQRGIAVAINGEIVRRSEWDDVVIDSGDDVEIVTAAAGG